MATQICLFLKQCNREGEFQSKYDATCNLCKKEETCYKLTWGKDRKLYCDNCWKVFVGQMKEEEKRTPFDKDLSFLLEWAKSENKDLEETLACAVVDFPKVARTCGFLTFCSELVGKSKNSRTSKAMQNILWTRLPKAEGSKDMCKVGKKDEYKTEESEEIEIKNFKQMSPPTVPSEVPEIQGAEVSKTKVNKTWHSKVMEVDHKPEEEMKKLWKKYGLESLPKTKLQMEMEAKWRDIEDKGSNHWFHQPSFDMTDASTTKKQGIIFTRAKSRSPLRRRRRSSSPKERSPIKWQRIG